VPINLRNELDEAQMAKALGSWLQQRMGTVTEVKVSELFFPKGNGSSNLTGVFKAQWCDNEGTAHAKRLVARLPPRGVGLFPEYDLTLQFEIMRALSGNQSVPVSPVLWKEDDPAVLGSPFFIMEHVDGKVPPDHPVFPSEGWVVDLSPDRQALLCTNGLRVLAAVHALDWEALGLGEIIPTSGGETPIDRELTKLEDYYAWASEGTPCPTIDRALAWARDHEPTDEPVVLSWGDSRIGNIMFGEDLSVKSVMDWEMATLASPEMDLGHWLQSNRAFSEGYGYQLPAGFFGEEEVVACYEAFSGYTTRHVLFYQGYAGIRMSITLLRVVRQMIENEMAPPDTEMLNSNPFTRTLAATLGLPEPEGSGDAATGRSIMNRFHD
jgi:aminoglycoside phosphotransferase (APT) family kinase protein